MPFPTEFLKGISLIGQRLNLGDVRGPVERDIDGDGTVELISPQQLDETVRKYRVTHPDQPEREDLISVSSGRVIAQESSFDSALETEANRLKRLGSPLAVVPGKDVYRLVGSPDKDRVNEVVITYANGTSEEATDPSPGGTAGVWQIISPDGRIEACWDNDDPGEEGHGRADGRVVEVDGKKVFDPDHQPSMPMLP
jgi:hypothetical protein